MEKIERLKRERAELDKRIETLEYAERLFEEGDEIYHVDEYGNVNSGKWGNFAWIDGAFSQGHIFRTKQDAERAIELFGDEIKALFVDCEAQ